MLTPAEQLAIVTRVAEVATDMLAVGIQGAQVAVPELGETWTISREAAS